jgi:hypothetical protein
MTENNGVENDVGAITSEGPSLIQVAVVCAAAGHGFFPLTRSLFNDYMRWKDVKDSGDENWAEELLTNMRIRDKVYANRFDQVREMLEPAPQEPTAYN